MKGGKSLNRMDEDLDAKPWGFAKLLELRFGEQERRKDNG